MILVYVRNILEMQWRMLQQAMPQCFVIAMGRQELMRLFIELTPAKRNGCAVVGSMENSSTHPDALASARCWGQL